MTAEHIATYYAATANDATRYPRLEGDLRVDVCVVGGGYSGIATALTLAERGYRVAIVEKHRVGWGSSGRNGGQMIAGISGEARLARELGEAGVQLLRDIRYRGHEIIEERVARYGIDCDLKHGWLEAAARPSHMAAIRAHYDDMVAEGHGAYYELVEPAHIGRVLGTKAYFGGCIDRRSGHLHPLNLCLGEARAAAGLGVAIFEETEALDLKGGAAPEVRTRSGTIRADHVVLAGDTEHGFRHGRLRGLQFPTGSYIIATEPLDEAMVRAINPHDLAVCDSNIVLDYFRLSADRRLLFGGRCNYSNRDPADITATMRRRLVEIFPQLRDRRVAFTWGGRIGIVISRVPAIGRLEPNLYYMQGYCGHGLNATHIAGEIVADAICGTAERLDLFEAVRHIRLPVGTWAGNQMLALGMLYYRLKDML